MASPIATLLLDGKSKDEEVFQISVEVGTPYKTGEGEWACPISVQPLYDRLSDIRGEDSFQALALAMRLALSLLKDFEEKGGELLVQGQLPGDEPPDTFPFEAYCFRDR